MAKTTKIETTKTKSAKREKSAPTDTQTTKATHARRSIARTIAKRLDDIVSRDEIASELRDYASRLSSTDNAKTVENAFYVELRDTINDVAYRARRAEKNSLASELSAIAKLTRRVERSTRVYEDAK